MEQSCAESDCILYHGHDLTEFGGQHSKLKTTEEWWFHNFATSSGYPRHLSPVEFSIPPSEKFRRLRKRFMFLDESTVLLPTCSYKQEWTAGSSYKQSDCTYYSSLTSWRRRLRLKIQYRFLFSLLQNVMTWAWNLLSMRIWWVSSIAKTLTHYFDQKFFLEWALMTSGNCPF